MVSGLTEGCSQLQTNTERSSQRHAAAGMPWLIGTDGQTTKERKRKLSGVDKR
jgi:hypothetical protein